MKTMNPSSRLLNTDRRGSEAMLTDDTQPPSVMQQGRNTGHHPWGTPTSITCRAAATSAIHYSVCPRLLGFLLLAPKLYTDTFNIFHVYLTPRVSLVSYPFSHLALLSWPSHTCHVPLPFIAHAPATLPPPVTFLKPDAPHGHRSLITCQDSLTQHFCGADNISSPHYQSYLTIIICIPRPPHPPRPLAPLVLACQPPFTRYELRSNILFIASLMALQPRVAAN